jgi:hypothetical protein
MALRSKVAEHGEACAPPLQVSSSAFESVQAVPEQPTGAGFQTTAPQNEPVDGHPPFVPRPFVVWALQRNQGEPSIITSVAVTPQFQLVPLMLVAKTFASSGFTVDATGAPSTSASLGHRTTAAEGPAEVSFSSRTRRN